MGQDESQAGSLAGIGQPIPAEHALATDGEALLVRLDELEEVSEVVVPDIGVDQFLALPIHDADVHLARVQIDSAVVFGRGGIILHSCIQCWGVLRTPLNAVSNAGGVGALPAHLRPMLAKTNKGFDGSINGTEPNDGGQASSDPDGNLRRCRLVVFGALRMSASLKIRWRKLSISLWLAALVASFVRYFDPSMANKITGRAETSSGRWNRGDTP